MESIEAANADLFHTIREKFFRSFKRKNDLLVVRSPGRINLIGEHTDYNEGFVLPAAIDRSIDIAISKRNDFNCGIYAADVQDSLQFDSRRPEKSSKRWANYLIGVIDQLLKAGHGIRGFDCVFGGNIPAGAGLSSSAAIGAGFAFALNELFELGINRIELALTAQRSEHEFVGVRCGIMDQFANLLSRSDSAFKLDCRSLELEYLPFDMRDATIVLCDTGVKHELANSEYNLRRSQCEEGVRRIAACGFPVSSLRDVDPHMLNDCSKDLDPVVYDRCSYVLEENTRVELACDALKGSDYGKFGELLYKSHDGLRRKYNVSCKELDFLVETASRVGGVFGSRMMGGGFGGCTINILEKKSLKNFESDVGDQYRKAFGRIPRFYECKIVSGTEIVSQ